MGRQATAYRQTARALEGGKAGDVLRRVKGITAEKAALKAKRVAQTLKERRAGRGDDPYAPHTPRSRAKAQRDREAMQERWRTQTPGGPAEKGQPSLAPVSGGGKGATSRPIGKPGMMQMAAGKGGGQGIPKAVYEKLRARTPSAKIRKAVNENTPATPYDDPALPGLLVTDNLEADHIVPMKTITEMKGFDQLSKADQLKVLNYRNKFTLSFVGLSKTANTSKGASSFSDWSQYKKMGIPVNPAFKQQMIQREKDNATELQNYINTLLKK